MTDNVKIRGSFCPEVGFFFDPRTATTSLSAALNLRMVRASIWKEENSSRSGDPWVECPKTGWRVSGSVETAEGERWSTAYKMYRSPSLAIG